jgi:hypothetical protein
METKAGDKKAEPKKIEPKAVVDKLAGFSKIASFKPKFISVGPVTSQSEKKHTFLDKAGNKHLGIAQRYDRNMNAPHIKAKKGDVIFIDEDNNIIANVTHFIP